MISVEELEEGKKLWDELDHREVLTRACYIYHINLSNESISFYDHSYWFEFTTAQKKQLLWTMQEIKNEACLFCGKKHKEGSHHG